MKKTDLEKSKAVKLLGKLKQGGTPTRFGTGSADGLVDRREQRRLDQAQGLVSFPLKLKADLIAQIRARATEQETSISEIVSNLLEKALKD